MAPGMWQILLVVLLAAVLFGGRGKIAAVMGDFAKGITSFRKGLKDDEDETANDAEDTSAIRDESRDDEKNGS